MEVIEKWKKWENLIDSREKDITFINEKGKKVTQRGKSTWKIELNNVVDINDLLDLFDFLSTEMKTDLDKFFNKSTKVAGRRSRNYAQKIKDTMGQIRIVTQNKSN